jgi:hypothetical protein
MGLCHSCSGGITVYVLRSIVMRCCRQRARQQAPAAAASQTSTAQRAELQRSSPRATRNRCAGLQVWELLDRVRDLLADRNTELLCEVHEHYTMQKRLAENGFWVYDFCLPMLCLQARL